MAPEPTSLLHSVSTVCATTFLLILPVRLWKLRNSSIRATPTWQGPFKACLGVLLSLILSSYCTKVSRLDVQHKAIFLASLFASIPAALGLSVLLLQEQQRSQRPSDLARLYLLSSILCDAVHLATPSKIARHANTLRPVLLRCCMHSALLVLECCAKGRPAFSELNKQQSPEELCGVLSRVLFTWINPILLRGYRGILVNQDSPPLGQDMKPEFTRKAILQAWSQRAKPETKKSLPIALMRCLWKPFLAAVIPRLFLILFRYSQPTLIKECIRFAVAYPAGAESSHGFWLVISAVFIYISLALSTAVYQHCINKLKLMTKSALVGLIHDKTMKSPSIAYDNGEVTTLMSTDADSLDGIAEMVHETWAQVIEVLIGIGLLASEVGWVWPLPLFLIYLCSYMSRFVAKHLQPRQKAWNSATQSRIAATTSVLSAMKDVKMLGLQHKLTHRIQQLRECELWAASKLRWIMVYYNASANALGIFSPAITLVMFAVISVARGGNLDTETAFTTMAILSMVTHPANMIMTIMPRAVAAFSGFERIQAFLLRQSLHAHRGTLPKGTMNSLPWNATTGDLTNPSTAIQIRQLRIGRKRLVLEHIDIEVAAGSITIISGPTGSGKSTLLRAILGEVVPVQGSISLSTRQISYCAQKTWLPNGTIKEIIYGPSDLYSTRDRENEIWFHEVTNLCCLTHDLNSLPHGDRTRIGSGGLNLSGGQRQRVALARALFARCDILLLDDAFSALDGETEQAIFDNLFGVTGIIRRLRTTVVLVSNSSQYFQAADHVVVLGDHRIIDQGNWQNIKVKAASVAKFSSSYDTKVSNAVLSAKFDELSAQLRANAETEIDLARQTGDPALYGYYLSFIDFENIFFLIISTLLYAFFITIPQYWLRLWTELDGRNTAFYVSGFLILSTLSWISTSAQMWSILIRLAPQSGLRLHQRLLHIVMSAPLSYFSKTDNGSILNRQIFKLLMQIVLLCMAEKWLTMSLPACMLLVCVVQKVYLRTSRQLRFLELESRAGVFLNFLECLILICQVEGLETIRSFGWSRTAVQGNIRSVDNSQRPEFLLLCLQRWLNLVLDLLGAAVATSVVALAVAFRGHVSGGQVGIALNIMLVTNSTLLKLVENWTMLETSMGAISRLKTLEETTAVEGGRGWNPKTPENWPSRGHIGFKDITVSYPSGAIALRNLSLNVTAGQKLVVCGRTGSGKSTLLLSLLRLLELQSGKIELDGVDIRRVRLDYLRRRCFVAVSQDPLLLLNETLRFNLDPDASISDDALVVALNKVGLWFHCFEGHTKLGGEPATVINVPGSGEHPILDQKVSNFQELSVGQRQLFALCRALVKVSSLRHSGVKPVVVLDEVTSSLDPVTECTIHCIIDEEFTKKGHTVIIVAHKLGVLEEHTKTGRDALALMADGQLQEVIEDLGPVVFQRFRQLE
ncbi:P-loop containing nucleoside triphosphate hydrolase protein [Aspergillus alliaceus]|uniref:P-loop containing nucleoside triphosphate hydrolase protein n=1 Tax=Petromyces alliaceus TaxID=209559 RepID=A0A5N7BRM6_PETAA|nr:P-loop containing nucleoside triphosphate hydrolase protein [Aspergillus alliaceus]